jgi:hypothetical protein
MVAERAFENKRIGQASAESNCDLISSSLESYLRLLTGATETEAPDSQSFASPDRYLEQAAGS